MTTYHWSFFAERSQIRNEGDRGYEANLLRIPQRGKISEADWIDTETVALGYPKNFL
jgi:hypothetical protein